MLGEAAASGDVICVPAPSMFIWCRSSSILYLDRLFSEHRAADSERPSRPLRDPKPRRTCPREKTP